MKHFIINSVKAGIARESALEGGGLNGFGVEFRGLC